MIFRMVRPASVMSWLRANAAGSANQGTALDCWRHYLNANSGGTGNINEMERKFLLSASASGKSLSELWDTYLAANGQSEKDPKGKARGRYK